VPVPRAITPQLDAVALLGPLNAPQGTCCCHDQTQRIGPHNPFDLAALILPKAIKTIAVANGKFHRPPLALLVQDVFWGHRQVGGEKGFDPWRWLALAGLFAPFGGGSPYHDDTALSSWHPRMPQTLPGVHLDTGCSGVSVPAQALAGEGLGGADQLAFAWPTAARARSRRFGQRLELARCQQACNPVDVFGQVTQQVCGGIAAISQDPQGAPGQLVSDKGHDLSGQGTSGAIGQLKPFGLWRFERQ
jgi:hypothetical protein